MELNRLIFIPRKRTSYETFDLSFILTRQYFIPLFTLFICLALPVFIVTGFLVSWYWNGMIMWWLKPIFERPLLDYMSKVVFNQPASITSSLKTLKQLKLVDVLLNLTIYRFTPNRAFVAPIEQLERLSGARRKNRKTMMLYTGKPKQMLWLLFCVHLEYIIVAALLIFLFMLNPFPLAENFWDSIFYSYHDTYTSMPAWVEISLNIAYMVGISVVGPLFVTGGFVAYLQRRIELEGWDIELAFKNIRTRLSQSLFTLSGIIVGLLFLTPDKGYAQEFNKEVIKKEVVELYQSDDVMTEQSYWQLTAKKEDREKEKEKEKEQQKDDQEPSDFSLNNPWDDSADNVLANIVWVLVAILALFMVYSLFKNRGFFNAEAVEDKPNSEEVIPTLFASVPQQVPAETFLSEALKYEENGEPRLALAYLLHHSLTWVQTEHDVKLRHSMTEKECQFVINEKVPLEQQKVFASLFSAWLNVAWGHQTLEVKPLIEQVKIMTEKGRLL